MSAPSVPESTSDLNHLFRLELGFYEVFHSISKRTKVFFTIPETVIMGFGFLHPTLLCTDYETGELVIREEISQKGLEEAIEFFEDLNKVKSNIPIAVLKLAATTYCKDTCKPLMSAHETLSVWESHAAQGHAQLLQRYVSGLARRPALIRATWEGAKVSKQIITMSGGVRSQSILRSFDLPQLTRKKEDAAKSAFFVYSKSDKAVRTDLPVAHAIDSKVMYLVTMLEKYYLPSTDLKIFSLEADFVQDEKGLCYLVNLRSFKLSKHLGYAPERPLKTHSRLRLQRKSNQEHSLPDEHSANFPVIPRIKHWNRAIQSHKRIVAVQEEKERAKLNRTVMLCAHLFCLVNDYGVRKSMKVDLRARKHEGCVNLD